MLAVAVTHCYRCDFKKYLIYIVWCLQYWVSLETTNCRFKQLVFVQSLFEHSKHVLAAVCLHISASVDGWTAGPDSCRVFEVLLTQTLIILKALNCSKPSLPHWELNKLLKNDEPVNCQALELIDFFNSHFSTTPDDAMWYFYT